LLEPWRRGEQALLATSSIRHRAFQRDLDQSLKTLFSGQETFADVTQLSLTYRGSRLSRDLDDTTGIRVGDRAPDATCIRAGSDEQVRLFDLFRGTHFTLLVFSEQPIPLLLAAYESALRIYTIARLDNTVESADHTLVDSEGQAYRAYGIRGDALILIRPDGYIGLTGRNISQEPIIDYLRNVSGQVVNGG
jgi:Aromatic-ring hydroxylase, C-terminal